MSSPIHMHPESDLALDLYDGDIHDSYYSSCSSYGLPNFREFGKRLGLIRRRLDRMLSIMLSRSDEVEGLVAGSGLSERVRHSYLKAFQDKMRKMSD